MNSQVKHFADCLLSGHQDAAWELLLEEIHAGKSSLEIYQQLITNALIYIGQLWEENRIKVADEHLASATCDFLLSRYFFCRQQDKKAQPANKKAMFFCLEQEQHYLGLKMASLLFEEQGWETRFLGPNLPLEYVLNMAESWRPDVIGLSFTTLYSADKLSMYIAALEELAHSPALLVGGRLIPKYDFSSDTSSSAIFIEKLEDIQRWMPIFVCGKDHHV
ncbi:cobalamin B12-binding domain-containing protein [Bacillus thermotolerans]|uniref:B12-binding domain-containing protein n=1 Tax=Bacillus thermotolerans TaxID=1221996 RepID=A0A0F5HM39_BACTR|nr:B12-binding domain-containing protein [Bacillus thermotolerans]KKB34333.1 hypothetical protein QY95_03944 [Bacillus thermotolerans]